MSRPWHDKYPIRSLRGDGDDERFEAFSAQGLGKVVSMVL